MPLRLSSIRHQCLCSNWTETHHRISRSWRSAASDFGLAEGSFTPPSALEIASREAEELAEAEKAEKHVLAFRREAIPIHGTIAETFLWGRGITCALPDTLRFRPASWHPTARRFPAMVVPITGLPRLALYRTHLRMDGTGKADAEPAEAMLGATAGGGVRLADEKWPLVVSDGIETALGLGQRTYPSPQPGSGPACPPAACRACACPINLIA
ncbi:hypothetical protein JWJ88_09430 [Paracoccus methylovorus]|uniref:DUF7146 domain-containing protein n=1 Tax=Paracoccus methylovorus TaxID=2812658 RepID=A0ABX7JF33_9RHOB|nr:hypothetical protein [Paracoccus methylovorus]QRZ12817.1 hypothetical protein JWJ88_09430 [Paracoccus methylovorus]